MIFIEKILHEKFMSVRIFILFQKILAQLLGVN